MVDNTDPVAEAATEVRSAIERATQASLAQPSGSELAVTGGNADDVKARLQAEHSTVGRELATARQKHELLRKQIEQKKAELDQMQRDLAAELEPVLSRVKVLQDGIAAVNLYLGRDEYLEQVVEGYPAGPEEPIHVRQLILAMDEETALIPELGGLDHTGIDDFLDWLRADPAHLQQVIPEPKCVVAFIARRDPKTYSDNPWENSAKQAEDTRTWWLIRNGGCLYLMTTEFQLGARLTPRRDELAGMFVRRNWKGESTGEPMEPGSDEWIAAEKRADARTRHYMKVALILQGLVDRTAVLAPLPTGGVNLLDQRTYDAGRAVIVADDDLQIGTGRQPFHKWQKERIAKLHVGMRVIGHFPSVDRDESYTTPRDAWGELRNTPQTIVRDDADNWYFTFDRTDYDMRWDQSTPRRRATYRLPKHQWQPQFIPVDLTTIDEMRAYLNARTERHNYRAMFTALTAAIEFKLAEEATEAPFRDLLAAELGKAGLVGADSEKTVRELVDWFKLANRWHRPLNGDPKHEALAARKILAEAHRRAETPADSDAIIASIREAVPDAIAIARRTNDWVAIEPQPRKFGPAIAPQNVFVRIHEFTARGRLRKLDEWRTLAMSQLAKWTIVHETNAFRDLIQNPPRLHLTDQEIDEAAAVAVADVARKWPDDEYRVRAVQYSEKMQDGSMRALLHVVLNTAIGRENGSGTDANQRYVPVAVSRGRNGVVVRTGYRHTIGWRIQDGIPEPPHEVNYWDHPGPGTVVWEDQEVAAADFAIVGPWAEKVTVESRIDRAVQNHYLTLERSWKRQDLERAKARFLEDYDDEELWEDHQKSVKLKPFPPRTSDPEGDRFRKQAFRSLRRAIVDDIDPSGFTFAELLAATCTKLDEPFADELLNLVFDEP